ncbi:MAG: hypothetical protein M1829_000561 [Trizodia sp. TS-e1964]|nr:MAG: hypothetical protein M1829_000561 [Trizodia sp. TS-e1964]
MSEDLEDRETNHWWKSKKWACSNLNRLFVRYGNPTSISKTDTGNYNEFSKIFIAEFAPEILRVYLQQVEKWVAKTAWLSRPCLSFTMAFLEECIKPKSTWNHLKPHIDTLVKHLLFPVLCQSDEDIELFESDPSEYIHKKLNFYEEVSAPDIAATNFLVTLTKSRKKQTFVILSFVNNIVIKYEQAPGDQRNPREMEGALRMIGTLASVILAKKSPIADQVEIFFVRHVFPEFRSPYGYLRARACDTLEKFSELNFTHQENLMNVYRLILELMGDPELPVRVEAALSLQPLIRHDPVRNAMQQSIPQIMQQLLKITNQVDLDALANVMEDFVEVFATELTPFAVALTEQLRDTYLRIVRELLERQAGKDDEDSGYGDYLDDKSITALGVLQTIGTLILTLESTPDVLLHLETILMPIITITLDNKLFDLYNEVFEIIDSCTFAAKSISPTMWQAFELIHKTFKSGAELYLEDMLPALDNFVAFGTEVLIQNRAYLEAVIDMVHDIFRDVKVGGVDRICGCKLAEAIMIHLRGHADQYIPKFVDLGMNCLTNEEPKVKSYRIHLMEMVINAIYYNPKLALHILESGGWTNKFFSAWFSSIDSFTRVHDKKLCIAAISALLTLRANEVPISVQQGWPRLLQGIVRLFQTLPLALKNREEVTKDEFALEGEFNEEEDENEWNGNETPWAAENEDAEEDVKDESNTYLEFLNNESKKFGAAISSEAEDDELEEESMLDTPLDKLEPYSMFRDALLTLQQSQPQLYENLTNNLTSEETLVVQNVVNQAHVLDQARAAEIAAAQAQLASSRQLISPT